MRSVNIDPRGDSDPIVRAELAFLKRTTSYRPWRALGLLFAAVFGLSLALAAVQYVGFQKAAQELPPFRVTGTNAVVYTLRRDIDSVLMLLVFASNFALCGQALLLAANTLARERQTGTWDLLILTEQSARQIVGGKWRATVRYVVETHAELILLRVAATLWLGIAVFATNDRYVPITDFPHTDPWRYLIAPLLVLAFTLLDLMLATTVGVALSTLGRREISLLIVGLLAGGLALLLRALGAGFLRPWIEFWPSYQAIVGAVRVTPLALFTPLVDGGVHLALEQILRHLTTDFASLLLVCALYLLPFGALTWIVLRLAGWTAARQTVMST